MISMKNTIIIVMIFLILLIFIIYISVVHFKEQYQQRDPILFKIKEKLALLSPKVHSLKFFQDNKSYTINKKKIYLCLRDEHHDYYPMNMLMYVAIHELAHVLCNEIGHTKKFYKIFDDLLKKAEDLGIYDPSIPVIQNYCEYSKETFVLSFNK